MKIRLFKTLLTFVFFAVTACGGGGDATPTPPAQSLVGIAVNSASGTPTLYVTDFGLGIVQSVSSLTGTATLTTIAGTSGSFGNSNGTTSTFRAPHGIASDSLNNLFISDQNSNEIRKITSLTGTPSVASFAGGTGGSADGTGPAASFAYPRGIAVDSLNNVYVAEAYNNSIRKITSAGVVTTLAGTAGVAGTSDGTGSSASFNSPFGLAIIETGGNMFLYVTDMANHAIRKIDIKTSSGTFQQVSTLAGSLGNSGFINAIGTLSRLNGPTGITTDGTSLFVSDTGNNVIRKITASSGLVETLAGSTTGSSGFVNDTGTAASFWFPLGLTYLSSGGNNLYVVDQMGKHIRKINTGSGAVSTLY